MTFDRLIVLFLLLIASAGVALANGVPIFMADTTAYVRGPDFAVVYFLGPKYATSWTQAQTLHGISSPHTTAAKSTSHDTRLNAPFDKAVLAGRSIYYGALLYISHLTSHLWLAIFVQAAIFLYLSYIFVIKCLRLSFFTYTLTTALLLSLTPVSFFISFLMPDIFASFLILGTIIIVGFWPTLRLRDKILVFSITCASALVHTSHLALLVCLSVTLGTFGYLIERRVKAKNSALARAALLLAIALISVFGELAFSYATRHFIGTFPVRPPFVMARLIADGPGYQYLKKTCPNVPTPYVVCKFLDRLPVPADAFLWSTDPQKGVFSISDLHTREAMSSEQTRFVFSTFMFDPIGMIISAIRNSADQFFKVGLNELFPGQEALHNFQGKLPAPYFAELLSSRIIFHHWLLKPLNAWFLAFYLFSTMALILVLAAAPILRTNGNFAFLTRPEWVNTIGVSLAALIFNAAICGALSQPTDRYQARIAWIPLFILVLAIASYWKSISRNYSGASLARTLA